MEKCVGLLVSHGEDGLVEHLARALDYDSNAFLFQILFEMCAASKNDTEKYTRFSSQMLQTDLVIFLVCVGDL